MKEIKYMPLLRMVQEYISNRYSAALSDRTKTNQLKSYISKYLNDTGYIVKGYTNDELIESLFEEMAGYSFLTKYLKMDDVEEININSWDDTAITYSDGRVVKCPESFRSPEHAVDTVKRLLQASNMIIDNATPTAQGHLEGNVRITAIKNPVADDGAGICVSIRLLHPSNVTLEGIIKEKTAEKEMLDFLSMCLNFGVSFVIAGATSSGKTTLLNALLRTVPNKKRIFTIESGSRELDLVKRKGKMIINNVVNTLSRPSDNPVYDISQEDLVVSSLRFNPDIVVVGEMRDSEAYAAVEASLTGHTVVSTIHANEALGAHTRLALLCQKRFPIDFEISLAQAARAFPIVVYAYKLRNNQRVIMDISECTVSSNNKLNYRTLYRYSIIENKINENGKVNITGHFEKCECMSKEIENVLRVAGVPEKTLERFSSTRRGSK